MFDLDIIDTLKPSEMKIYKFIVTNNLEIPYMTIRELADKTSVSTATILRFCKKLGYAGFQEFKYSYRLSLQDSTDYQGTDFLEIIDCLKRMDTDLFKDRFNKAVHLMGNADALLFIGTGDSGIMAQYAARRFSCLGKFALAINDPYYKISNVDNKYVAIVLTISGETPEIYRQVRDCRKLGFPIISITMSEQSTIAKISDVTIPYYINQYYKGGINLTSQVPVLSIIENLAKLKLYSDVTNVT